MPASILHLASPTDAREVYVGPTRHTQDAWVVAESGRLDALCRRRQSDARMKPTTNDTHERLFREARQYGEKRNVVDYVDEGLEFARTGNVRVPTDERSQGFARRAIEAARAVQRALAWLRDGPLPAPAWMFLDRTSDRIHELPLALREIVARRAPSRSRGPDRSGPDLGR